MRVVKLLIASCILTTAGANLASAQFVDPFKVLEEAKRDRLELDKRLAREAAERRQKEKAEQAEKLNAQRKLDQQRSVAVSASPPVASAEQASASQKPEIDMQKKRIIGISGVVVAAALAGSAPAEARGCLKGALVGGVAGHYAGHHGLIGAVGGCLSGRHLANRHTTPVSNPNAPPPANRSSSY